MSTQDSDVDRSAISGHDAGERPLVPAIIWNTDDGGFEYIGVIDEHIFKFDR